MTSATSPPTNIACVKIHSPQTRYENVTLPSDHSIFSTKPLPITVELGYPLVITRLRLNLPRGSATDNQHATWLNIDPVTGFAPEKWQGGIGSVIVAAKDRTALDAKTLGAIVDYVSNILDAFGGKEGEARAMYGREKLGKFVEGHLKMQKEYRDQMAAFQSSK